MGGVGAAQRARGAAAGAAGGGRRAAPPQPAARASGRGKGLGGGREGGRDGVVPESGAARGAIGARGGRDTWLGAPPSCAGARRAALCTCGPQAPRGGDARHPLRDRSRRRCRERELGARVSLSRRPPGARARAVLGLARAESRSLGRRGLRREVLACAAAGDRRACRGVGVRAMRPRSCDDADAVLPWHWPRSRSRRPAARAPPRRRAPAPRARSAPWPRPPRTSTAAPPTR